MIIELCLAPKSNTAYSALDAAIRDIENGNTGNLPEHLRTNSRTYKYPHEYPNCFVKQQYLPDRLKGRNYYRGKASSNYEKQLVEAYQKFYYLQNGKKN